MQESYLALNCFSISELHISYTLKSYNYSIIKDINMHHIALVPFLFVSSLYAITLDEVISHSLSKSPSLEAIEARVEANKQNINISKQFSNPELLLSKNTLDSSQAMSKTVLSIKQKLPFYGKRDANEKVSLAEDELLMQKLQTAKVTLVERIKNEAYTIWELQELQKIINEYIELTTRNIELYESYASTNSNQHIGIMKAELSLSELKIQQSSINSKIYSAYSRLSYLSAIEIKDLDIELKLDKKPNLTLLQNSLSSNPQIVLKEKELQKQNAKVEMASRNNYPDVNLIAGYAYRENFDDYLKIGVGLTLPIYSTEDYKAEKSRAVALSARSMKEDTVISVNSTLKVYYSQMLSSYEIYHIIQDDSLPKIEHMFELSSSSISTGADLFKYIDVLFSKLNLEKKSVNAISNYKRAEAKISQLSGALK